MSTSKNCGIQFLNDPKSRLRDHIIENGLTLGLNCFSLLSANVLQVVKKMIHEEHEVTPRGI
jgi:hypothetical protein